MNNAGIGAVGRVDVMPLDDHHRILDVNLNGVFHGMQAVAGHMRAQGAGAIGNISSIDGLAGVLGMTSYDASKFAVTGMTRSAAIDLGSAGIRVNSVHPGVSETPLSAGVVIDGGHLAGPYRPPLPEPRPTVG